MKRRFNELNANHQQLLLLVVPAVEAALRASGVKQQAFARRLGVSRTVVSHLVNCLKPTTKNPEFRSVSELRRLSQQPLIKENIMVAIPNNLALVPASSEDAYLKAKSAIQLYIKMIVKEEVVALVKQELAAHRSDEPADIPNPVIKSPATKEAVATTVPGVLGPIPPAVLPVSTHASGMTAAQSTEQLTLPTFPPAPKKKRAKKVLEPARGQAWTYRGNYRAGKFVEVESVHRPKGKPEGKTVSVRHTDTGVRATSTYLEFMRRYRPA